MIPDMLKNTILIGCLAIGLLAYVGISVLVDIALVAAGYYLTR